MLHELAAATGLGKGSLYGAFGDKRQLYLRVFHGYCTDVTEATRRSLSGPDDGAYARLRAYMLAVLRGIEALGKANTDKRSLRSIAEAALDTLPRP